MNLLEGEPWLKCPTCGYDVRGLPENRCPECGRPFDPAILRRSFEAARNQSFSDLLFEYSGKAILTFMLFFPVLFASLAQRRFGPASATWPILVFGGFAISYLALLRGFLKRLSPTHRARRGIIFATLGIILAVFLFAFLVS
jgi:hypothetical protein